MLKGFLVFALVTAAGDTFGQSADAGLKISDRAIQTIVLDGYPDFLASDGDDVWITNSGKLQKLSAGSQVPVLTVPIPDPCGAPIIGEGSLYAASCKTKTIYRIDRLTGKIISTISCPVADREGEISLAFGAGSLWVLSDSTGILSRIDPGTSKLIARIRVKPKSYCAVFGFSSVWITNSGFDASVQRIDPERNAVIATIPVGSEARFLTAGAGGVWTLNQSAGTVSRIDPVSNRVVATIPAHVAGSGGDIDAQDGGVWVRAKSILLQRINPETNAIGATYQPPSGSGAVRVTAHHVWVTAHDVNTVWVLNLPPQPGR